MHYTNIERERERERERGEREREREREIFSLSQDLLFKKSSLVIFIDDLILSQSSEYQIILLLFLN